MSNKGRFSRIVVGIFVMIAVGVFALGCSGGKSESSSAPSEPEATQEQQAEPEKKEEAPAEAEAEPEPEAQESEAESGGIDESLVRPEFKEAMDSYEAFFDEYVEFMKAYKDDPTNAELMMGLADMTAREADMISKLEAWKEEEGLTTAETAYLLEVESRIYAKLAEVM